MIRTAYGETCNGHGNEDTDRRAFHERTAGATSAAGHTLVDRVTDHASIGIKARCGTAAA